MVVDTCASVVPVATKIVVEGGGVDVSAAGVVDLVAGTMVSCKDPLSGIGGMSQASVQVGGVTKKTMVLHFKSMFFLATHLHLASVHSDIRR